MAERVALVENFLECRLSGRVDEASAYLADEVVYERGKKGCLVGVESVRREFVRQQNKNSLELRGVYEKPVLLEDNTVFVQALLKNKLQEKALQLQFSFGERGTITRIDYRKSSKIL